MNGRILVCFSSLLRHFEHTWPTIRRHVIEPLPTLFDVAGHFPASERGRGAERLAEMAGDCRLRFEGDPEFPAEWLSMEEGIDPEQPRGVFGNLLQWNSLARCADLKREMEADHGVYDWVVWMRPDLYFFSPIEDLAAASRDAIYFPIHDAYWGLNDRFCFGESQAMELRMRILDFFVNRWYGRRSKCRHVRRRENGSMFWNPEVVLRSLIDDHEIGLRRTESVSGLVRASQENQQAPTLYVSQPQVWDTDVAQPPAFRATCRRLLTIPTVRRPIDRVPLMPLDDCTRVFAH
ncbi:MAG: hypothetical protein KDA42_05815 [Planctomycetales bacterium]|nr:hypothetical protein [Planctomycetales bacterium]